jgi:hypothetical protein
MVRNGHDYKGDQKYHCKACESYGTLQAQPGYDERTCAQVKQVVLERISWRGIERLFGISRRTVAEWIEYWADQWPSLETTLAEAQVEDVLERDERWSLGLKKANQRWVWVALCRRTRQIVADFIGDRREASCLHLWRRPRAPIRAASRSAISGKRISASLRRTTINRWAKTAAKPTISSAGSTPCANAWPGLFANPCLFQARPFS